MPTQLLFLDHNRSMNNPSSLYDFLKVLSEYSSGTGEEPFPSENLKDLEENIVKHIKKDLIPKNKSHEHTTVKTTNSIPVLLFIIKNIGNIQDVEPEALLFLSNVHMMKNKNDHGGFYTQNKKMIDIYEGLFISMFDSAQNIPR